ncbi:hypothetical protein [Streptomyces sp. NPDC007205]|uniref:hypothetical protein n=1 Tax=Streptomyces sp. NPDC007205 TaxID=3154316 RepID=UPI0033CB6872
MPHAFGRGEYTQRAVSRPAPPSVPALRRPVEERCAERNTAVWCRVPTAPRYRSPGSMTSSMVNFEEQIGAHGGLGGAQCHPFLLSPLQRVRPAWAGLQSATSQDVIG